jgi:hypothetical protein
MGIRKYVGIVRAAGRDAALARGTAHTPQFQKAVTTDRRSALSEYATVKHALRDRARLAATKGGEKNSKGKKRANGKKNKKT